MQWLSSLSVREVSEVIRGQTWTPADTAHLLPCAVGLPSCLSAERLADGTSCGLGTHGFRVCGFTV